MLVTLMKAKLHRATVTQADMDYEGSIAIDRELLDASGILPHEQVDVLNITTGARFTTYAIEAPRGSRVIGVNGAAARLVQKGDKVIIVTYGLLPAEEARNYSPTVVLLDDANEMIRPREPAARPGGGPGARPGGLFAGGAEGRGYRRPGRGDQRHGRRSRHLRADRRDRIGRDRPSLRFQRHLRSRPAGLQRCDPHPGRPAERDRQEPEAGKHQLRELAGRPAHRRLGRRSHRDP